MPEVNSIKVLIKYPVVLGSMIGIYRLVKIAYSPDAQDTLPAMKMCIRDSCMLRRLHEVVLPEEEGPDSSTSFTPLRLAISSASLAIFFSCSASLILMMSVA